MSSTTRKFNIPLHLVNQEYRYIHKKWLDLNDKLPEEIENYVNHYETAAADKVTSSFSQRINLNRFKQAVGYNNTNKRLGLIFLDYDQQNSFVTDFISRMNDDKNNYTSYTLVATGSSFQGFSTNPCSYKEFGYMKMCGDTGKTDLDLQLYCSKMCQQALNDRLPLFDSHFKIEGNDAMLITFDNESDGDVAPYKYSPWIRDFQNEWQDKLSLNFCRTGVKFDGVHIALMTDEKYTRNNKCGSPYVLCDIS